MIAGLCVFGLVIAGAILVFVIHECETAPRGVEIDGLGFLEQKGNDHEQLD
jgi:hypothetical protein